MELYYSPMACSLASHITLREAGLEATLTPVSLKTKTTAGGADYLGVNQKGQVPTLRLDDGSLLTENAAVLQYLADRRPASGLLPAVGERARYAVLEWVSYFGTEVHKACLWPIFNDAPAEAKPWARSLLDRKLAYVGAEVGAKPFVVGERFTIADAYLAWIVNLCVLARITLPPELEAYRARVSERPAVKDAVARERAELTGGR